MFISANVAAIEPYTQYRDQDSDKELPNKHDDEDYYRYNH